MAVANINLRFTSRQAPIYQHHSTSTYNKSMVDDPRRRELAARVARALDAIQKRFDISQAAVARKLNQSPQTISAWKRTGKIDHVHFAALAELSGLSIDYFHLIDQGDTRHKLKGVREDKLAYRYELHPVTQRIQALIDRNLLTEGQIAELDKYAQEKAELTSLHRSTAIRKSARHA
jgi:transcriptional regulator with XRE-family HTH domain